jgi:heme exporter protein B
LIFVLMAMLAPLFCVLMGFEIAMPWRFVVVLAVGGYALAVITTIVAAIIAQALTRGALFSVLSLPLLLPLLIIVIEGTRAVATGDLDAYSESLRAMITLAGAMTIVSAFLFPVVWRD